MATSLDGSARLAPQSKCERIAIPFHSDRTSKLLEMTGSWVSIKADGTMDAEVAVRNRTDKSLSFALVLVNYLDENGDILFAAPFQANLPSEEQPRNLRSFSILELNEPLRPGQQVTLTAGRDLLTTTKMPASAEVAYWLARFTEGGSATSTALGQGGHGFRTDPLLIETPGPYLRLSFPHPAESVETLFKLQTNEYGRVLEARPALEGDSILSRLQLEALSQLLSQWRFFPAIENGYAVASELYLLVDLLPENPLPIRRCFLEHPERYPQKFAFVTLEPIPDTTNWMPVYEGLPADGKIEPNVIKIKTTEAQVPK